MTNLTALTANASPALVDLLYSVDDPAGVPAPRKVTLQSVMDLFEANMTVPTSVSSAYRTSTILASTSTGEGASLIGIEDAATNFTATTVEGALAEIISDLASTSTGLGASTVGVEDSGAYFTATNVETVLAELGALLPTGSIVGTTDTQTLTNKTLTAPRINQIDDTNGNESITLTATASGVSYLNVASGTTGNDVVLTGTGETNTGISIQASGTGNVTLGNYVIDADATIGAGQDNYVLTYDHGTGTWRPEASGGGDVSVTPTPSADQVAVWSGAAAIEGDSGFTWNGTTLEITGDIVLNERADHGFTPAAGKGILWVSNDATQKLYFTNDAGTDNEVLTAGSGSVLADTVAASDDKFVFFDTSDSDNPKYSNDIAGDLNLAKTTGSTYTGAHNFGGADDFEIPNGTSPVVDTDGQIAIDTSVTDFSHGLLKYFSGEEMIVVAMPTAQFVTPADQYVVTYDATADEFQLTVKTGSGIAAVVDDTTPQLGGMLDVNGNAIGDGTRELLTFTEDAAGVNHVNIENQATGGGPIISAAGDDANVDLNLAGKGTGIVAIGSAEVATISAAQTLTNKTIDSANNTLTVDLAEATVTGTTAQFNTALSDGSFATLAGTEVLLNKTLTAPTIDLSSVTSTGDLAVADGGTGASTASAARTNLGAAALGANTFTGTQDFNGQQVEGYLNKVVSSVTGALTAADHSGNILVTSGNVTVPTTAGFTCTLIAGGAHTVTFNATTSAAMAAGDVMTVVVESSTVIHAVLTASADKVSFT